MAVDGEIPPPPTGEQKRSVSGLLAGSRMLQGKAERLSVE